ncbi:MAG TPA: hypothetical protein VGI32_01175 [Steroidobacteraceae bacterium]
MSYSIPALGNQDRRDAQGFSLVLGGPLFQLWLGTRLSGGHLELMRRRILVMVCAAWLPLLLLSAMEGHAWGASVKLPFLLDAEQNLRLLVALPLMIAAELTVHTRMRQGVAQFLVLGLIPDGARAQFDSAVASAMRLRNSRVAELLLLALVYGLGVPYLWRNYVALDLVSWYGVMEAGKLHPSLAGWWLGCVSVPLLQFLFLRWYFRLFIWTRFLWQVSRIELRLLPTHPDRCGGLSFLKFVRFALAPLLLAQGVDLAGVIANRIFFAGGALPDFLDIIAASIAVAVLIVLGPLLVFTRRLEAIARSGAREYGELAQRYARDFDQKWLRGGAPADEPLLGSEDIESLADMGNSFQVVQQMRFVPFTLGDVIQVAVISLSPLLPLALTMFSLHDLMGHLLRLIF